MKPKTLLVLLVVVGGLAAFIGLYERKLPGSTERRAQSKKLLPFVKADEVKALEVETGGVKLRLERPTLPSRAEAKSGEPLVAPAEEHAWKIVAPVQARADRWTVERVVDSVLNLEKERTLANPDRKDLGLDAPRARVRLFTESGEKLIEVGAAIPASSSMAVGVGGEKDAYIVANAVFADLTKPAGDWRSRDLFVGQRDDIERVTLVNATQKVLLAKRGDGFWLESPIADRADRDAVSRLLGDLTAAQVKTFVDHPDKPLAALGLEPPVAVVEAVLKGKEKPFRLELGNPDPQSAGVVWARVDGQVFQTESKLPEAARKAPAEWRAMLLSGLEVFRVEQLKVEGKGPALRLQRAGTDWTRNEKKISFTPVSDLLYAVTSARAEKLLTKAEARAAGAALDKPSLTVQLVAADKTEETLSLYPPLPDGSVPAMASGRDAILMLPKTAGADIDSKLETLRKAEPLKSKGEDEAKGKQE